MIPDHSTLPVPKDWCESPHTEDNQSISWCGNMSTSFKPLMLVSKMGIQILTLENI